MARKDNQSHIPLEIDMLEIDMMELGKLIKKSNLYKSIRKKLGKIDFYIGYIEPFSAFPEEVVGLQLKLYKKSPNLEDKDEMVKTLAGLFLLLAQTSSGCLSFNVTKNTDDMFKCIVYRVVDEYGNRIDTSFIESGRYTCCNIENFIN